MTKLGYVLYLGFILVSSVSVFLCDRDILAGELILSILFTLFLLWKLWKCERLERRPTEKASKQDDVHYAEINLDEQRAWLKKRQQIMESQEMILRHSLAYKHFVDALNHPTDVLLTDDDWEELVQTLEQIIPNFQRIRLDTEYMSQDEYRMCVLIRCGFKPSEIAIMMRKSNTFITKTRQSLLDRIFHVSGSASEFDIRILDII